MPDTLPNQDLDLTLLNEIADGNDAFIVESIDLLLQQTPELLQLISDSIAEKDWENTGASAHKLKSTIGFFGMLNTQELLQQVESACIAGGEDPDNVILNFSEVKSTMAVNMIALAKIKAEIQARL